MTTDTAGRPPAELLHLPGDGFVIALEAHADAPAVLVLLEAGVPRSLLAGCAGVQEIEQRTQLRGRAGDHGHFRLLRQRPQLERHLRDDAERAERADEQLAQVVAGDVLDDAAAGLELLRPRR